MPKTHAQHGRDHCPNGSDPIPCLGGEVVHLFTWNYDTDNTIPSNTWLPVANFASGGGFFETSFHKGSWTFDNESGQVTLSPAAEYMLTGWVQFNESAGAGEKRFVAVNFGSSDRYLAEFPFEVADGSIAELKLPVTTIRSTALGSTTAWLEVRHNSGSTRSIRDAEFSVRRHEYTASGEVTTYDPFA